MFLVEAFLECFEVFDVFAATFYECFRKECLHPGYVVGGEMYPSKGRLVAHILDLCCYGWFTFLLIVAVQEFVDRMILEDELFLAIPELAEIHHRSLELL
jgi:hypothetical protein